MVKLAGFLTALIVSGIGIAYVSATGLNLASTTSGHYSTTTGIPQTSVSSSTTASAINGTLAASISMGPIQPVCRIYPADQPPPSYYSSIEVLITDSAGHQSMHPVSWASDGCYVTGAPTVSLRPGSYQFSLSNCTLMGCRAELPKGFGVYPGQTTDLSASIFTGIA